MSQARTTRRRRSSAPSKWLRILKGLGAAVLVTLIGVAVLDRKSVV